MVLKILSGNVNKEDIKQNQSELRNTVTELKNTLEEVNSSLEDEEEWISDLKDQAVEIIQAEQQKGKMRTG